MPSESEIRTWKCHQCPAVKGERNGWWIIFLGRLVATEVPVLELRQFTAESPPAEGDVAICGDPACLNAEIHEFKEKVGGKR